MGFDEFLDKYEKRIFITHKDREKYMTDADIERQNRDRKERLYKTKRILKKIKKKLIVEEHNKDIYVIYCENGEYSDMITYLMCYCNNEKNAETVLNMLIGDGDNEGEISYHIEHIKHMETSLSSMILIHAT